MNEVLEKKVAQAVFDLIQSGVKPTQKHTINLIGGSFSTVSKIFSNFKSLTDDFTELNLLEDKYSICMEAGNKLFVKLKKEEAKVAHLEKSLNRIETILAPDILAKPKYCRLSRMWVKLHIGRKCCLVNNYVLHVQSLYFAYLNLACS